jgi:hypothetical protein
MWDQALPPASMALRATKPHESDQGFQPCPRGLLRYRGSQFHWPKFPFGPRFAYLSPDERFLYFEQREDPKQRVVLVRGLF